MQEYISKSVEDTKNIAEQILASLQGGEILALSGNLGAGKTVFVKAIAEKLGVTENVTSPTFVLMKIYKLNQEKINRLVHVDCYRLDQGENLEDIGLADYIGNSDTLVIIEWADRVQKLPENTINIKIDYIDDKQRKIIIE